MDLDWKMFQKNVSFEGSNPSDEWWPNGQWLFFFEGRVETDGRLTSEAPPKSVNGQHIFFPLSLRIPTLTDDFTTQVFVQGPNVSDKCQQLVRLASAGVYSFLTCHFLSDCANEQCGRSGRVRRGKNTKLRFDWLPLNNNIWFCFFQPHSDGTSVHWGQF